MLLTCPECGAPVIDKLDSCRECGCPIDYIKHHQTTQLECPECSNIFDESLECCSACGCPTDYIKLHKIPKTPKYSATTAPDELRAAAAHGNTDAMYWLANCMYFGENGFKADPSESSKWLQKAARLGHIQAQKDYPLWFPIIPDKKDTKYDILKNILNDFDSIIIFDLETSGLDSIRNSIIELAAIKVELANNHVNISKTLNEMILLPAGEKLSPKIEELTGITNEELNLKGRSSVTVCEDFVDFVGPDKPLMIFSTFEDHTKKRVNSGKPLTPGIRISTIHSAKGLEYDVVIITGLSAGQYPNTEQIDRKYAERNEQLKTFQESRTCYYQQKQELDQSIFTTLLQECDSPCFTESELDRMQDFQQELFDMKDSILTLSADGVEEYLDAYVYYVMPLLAQYDADITKLNTDLLNKQTEIEETKEKILVAMSDESADETEYNPQLKMLNESIAETEEEIVRIKIKKDRFMKATSSLNSFYTQCLTVKGLLADMTRADEIEELQQELKAERIQRTNGKWLWVSPPG